MGHKVSGKSSSLPLDVFRSQIKLFKQTQVIPRFDESFEKDAILAALKRIDPTLPDSDASLHAAIVMNDSTSSLEVTHDDIQYAVRRMTARQTSMSYPILYALKSIGVRVDALLKNQISALSRRLNRSMTAYLMRHKNSYSSSLRHA